MVNTDKHHVAHHVAATRLYDLGDANTMVVGVVEFSREGYKIRKVFA